MEARGGPLEARYGDLFPAHPVERPNIVERLQAIPAAEYLDLVLVQNRCVRVAAEEPPPS
jgi:hypothetical protein